MPSRKSFFSPIVSYFAIGLIVVILTYLIPIISGLAQNQKYLPERHALLEYFVAYIGICLFFICLRRFHLQRTKEFLFFGLAFLTFVIFQIFQSFAFPGFHDIAWLPPSVNTGLAFEIIGRMLFSVYFLIGIFNINKPMLQPTFRNISLIYLNALAFVFFIVVSLFNFLPPILYQQDHTTLLKKGLDLFSACLIFCAAAMLLWRFHKDRRALYFWFIVASVFGVFTNVYLSFWNTLFDVSFDFGHALKGLFITSFLVGIFADQLRFLKIEKELRESLEKSKKDLEKSEKTFQNLVEKMADGFIVTDKRGTLIFTNQAIADMLHYDTETLLGKHISVFFDPANYEKLGLENMHNGYRTAEQLELEMLSRDGEKVPVLINTVPIIDARGDYSGIQSVVTNLTERKRIELGLEKLVKEKTKDIEIFKQSIENSTDGILITDLEGQITYVNRTFTIMTGYAKSELIGHKTDILKYDQRSENVHKNIWSTISEGKIWRGEFDTKRKDGSAIIGELSVVPIKQEIGQTVNYLWIEKDVTRRKTLERSLEEYAEELTNKTSELQATTSYYETLISGMSDILLVVDNDANCTFINEYGRKLLQYRAEELTKQHLPIFFDDLKRLEKNYGPAMRVEIKDFESQINTKDGKSILCSWNARPLFDRYNRRIGAMAVGRDISEYKRMQNELKEYAKNLEFKVKKRTEELQKKVNQLARLLEIGEEIRLNVDIDVILNRICEAVQALGWKKAIISLRDYKRQTSRVVATAGLEPGQVEEVMNWGDIPFKHTEKYFNPEYQISNSYYVPHNANLIHENTPFSLYTELGKSAEDEWHALDALLVPIRTKDKVLGVISVDAPDDHKKPTLNKIRDLEIFADNAALAIENARLFQVQKENEKHATLLAEISQIFHSSLKMKDVLTAIVNKGGKAIGDFCSLLLLEDTGDILKPYASYHESQAIVDLFLKGYEEFPSRIGEGLIGNVAFTGNGLRTSKPFSESINEFSETPFYYVQKKYDISSLMLLPLRVRDRIIGIMVYLVCHSRRKYKESDLKLAQELADRAAIAIENARLFKEAAEKARELEKANKLKTEFLANVSHELRTPLNAIITISDILIRGISGDLNAEQNKQLQIIQRSGRNLLTLINDILDLSKIESGRAELRYSVIPIRAVIEETIEHIRPLCIEKNLKLDHEFSEDVPDYIHTDQDKLTKALVNVLSNAVKFTRKGRIHVAAALKSASVLQIKISDTGIGIPKDRLDEIFNEFQQIDSSDSRKFGGTGLGLSITRNVLAIIGGSVSVESKLGKGSTFTLIIPFQTKTEAVTEELETAAPVSFVEQKFDDELDLDDDREQLDKNKKTILVVDDEKEAIYIMCQFLHENSFQIVFPQNGEDVVELAKQFHPFAITLDLIMPETSGWEVLESLKKDDATKDIPIVVTSILSEQERAFDMGVTEYLVKPFKPQNLVTILKNLEISSKKKRAVLDLPLFFNIKKLASKRLLNFSGKSDDASQTMPRVLIVDDDLDTQYAIKYILDVQGYRVYFANEGQDAIRQAEAIKPDLILMDIMMPGMDGYEATRRLKADENFKNIPIIAMTAKAMKGDREKVLLAGCDDYIAKPFMIKDILSLVEKWSAESQLN
ncbi:MAG: PAS domain S-box protein [bacterium]